MPNYFCLAHCWISELITKTKFNLKKNIGLFFVVLQFIMLNLPCKASNALPSAPPRLIVFISVDQLRPDLIHRYKPYFGENGFRRLIREGAVFTSCRYDYTTCYTAVGHATMVSGTYPFVHGIIGNNWYDRQSRTVIYSVADSFGVEPDQKDARSPYGRSPRWFMGTTIGDEMKFHTGGKSLVYSVSNKDRAAILMAGKMADGAFWWNLRDGRWISSKHYMSTYPDWLMRYNQTRPLDRWFAQQWTLLLDSSLYPAVNLKEISFYDQTHDIGLVFPHRIGSGDKPNSNFYRELMTSPYASIEINRFIQQLFEAEPLGKDSIPDLLCISYSAGDYIGHQFGPYSRETMDYIIRMDQYLDTLFQILNRFVGLNHTLIVLTSDHGIAPIPESLHEKFGILRVNLDTIAQRIHDRMTARYGKLSGSKKYGIAIEPAFYFDPEALKEKKIEKEKAEKYIKKLILNEQWNGIDRVYTYHELINGMMPDNKNHFHIQNSFYSGRSGDVIITLKPFHVWDYNGKGTEHGQWFSYDSYVPLYFWGSSWFRHGVYHQKVSPVDIAPTLAVILGTAFPSGTIGKVIDVLLK